eukprot:gene27925-21356_t
MDSAIEVNTCSSALRDRVLKKGDKGWVARAASKTKKVLKGKGKSYTAMKPKGSRWLHTEAAICDGIAFKTFFVGSIQVY